MFGLISGWTTLFPKFVQFTNDMTTAWLGAPMVADNYASDLGASFPMFVIGLRSDGVVVWKAMTNR